ncbi:hypothetical protein [Acinetobacter baumannii]|uniref:hypothetical protein n=1 Tax=Acinetobacter baumannii TaxID=470 RepID=UPI00244C6A86|nr:hypothetical protein [Acinetobacter baumannii]MDH2570054.1 hypothetical protein [Acinetobacter baumannii]
MTTTIHSNVKASRYIASRLALTLPSDFKHKLDFTAENYVYNGVKSSLAQCISTTRASTAGYINSDGVYATALANQPRIHNDPNAGKGLLCEDSYVNLITNYSNPPNQTVAILVDTTRFLVIQMFGEGSCEVKINDVNLGTISKNNPLAYKATSAGSISLSFTNSGEVNHVQAFLSYLPKPCMTKLTTTTTQKDIHYFRPNFIDNSVATIVFKRTELKDSSDVLPGSRAFVNFQFLSKTSGFLSLTSGKGTAGSQKSFFYQLTSGGAISEVRIGTSLVDEVVAIAFDFMHKTLKIYENGQISNLTLPDFADTTGFDRYILGTFAAGAQPVSSQLIKEMYVYNRMLTDAELLKIATY